MRVHIFVTNLLQLGGGHATDAEVAAILRTISDWHQQISALPTETIAGGSYAAAVRAVASVPVGEVFAARRLAMVGMVRDDLLQQVLNHRLLRGLEAYQLQGQRAARVLDTGRLPPNAPDMPIYRVVGERSSERLTGLHRQHPDRIRFCAV